MLPAREAPPFHSGRIPPKVCDTHMPPAAQSPQGQVLSSQFIDPEIGIPKGDRRHAKKRTKVPLEMGVER